MRLRYYLRFVLSLVLATGLGTSSACIFDRSGFGMQGDGGQNNSPLPDAEVADGAVWLDAQVDAQAQADAQPDVYVPPCSGDTWECLGDGTARVCQDNAWVAVGDCPLGCDSATRVCRTPSNVPGELMGEGTAAVDLDASDSPVTINTDTGEIGGSNGQIRAPGPGLDGPSGIYFEQRMQGSNPGLGLGVFVVMELTVDAGTLVNVEGQRSLVLLVDGAANIHGVINASAHASVAGPGGHNGGAPGQQGNGSCGGSPGQGEQASHGCNSGGGGGGHAGAGGEGGNSTCGSAFVGGFGGPGTCGVPELVPLVGGSGGAGGVPIPNVTASPGAGGGGGGALQLSAGGGIFVGGTGGINTGGGGGGQCTSAGGAGAGAGGAILLEGPTVTVQGGGVLAANGGGGGGGDCT